MGRLPGLIHTPDGFTGVGMRKTGMMHPAMPDFIQLKEVGAGQLPVINIPVKAPAYTIRPEQNSVWILQDREFQFSQGIPDMFGKTGADQHDLILVPDRVR